MSAAWPLQVAIFDATNSTESRRQTLVCCALLPYANTCSSALHALHHIPSTL
jgi:hypothetical protein